ncbi:MAG: zf-HC2 domain-containing protein [Nitrosomonadales bacterium]|nr:zf-HC2 domain-containing protein [Nitrosomonadales bacterium]
MLNCKHATMLMSQGMDKKLGMMQKMGLRFHLMMCSGCRNFNKQMEFLRQGCRKFTQQDSM